MKVIVIGDIHGRNEWKSIADLSILSTTPNLKTDYDKYIFLGDYVDSFTITGNVILENLKEIVQLKKNYPDNIVLLLGNHDLHYLFSYETHRCSGYNSIFALDYKQIFNENIDLFEPIYQIGNYIFSHAGISNQWWEKFLKNIKLRKNTKFNSTLIVDAFKTYYNRPRTLNSLFDVGYSRGGFNAVGGIFWADFRDTYKNYLDGYHQIVGHTRIKKITSMPNEVFSNEIAWPTGSITYIDVLENVYESGSGSETHLILEIDEKN